MKKNTKLKFGAFLSYVIVFVNMIIGIIYTPILTKMLGQSEYGLYSLVTSIITYFTVLDLGFGNAIIIYTARYRARNDKISEQKLHGSFFLIYVVIGLITTVLGIILSLNVDYMFSNTMTEIELYKAKIMMVILTFNVAITFPFSVYTSIIKFNTINFNANNNDTIIIIGSKINWISYIDNYIKYYCIIIQLFFL